MQYTQNSVDVKHCGIETWVHLYCCLYYLVLTGNTYSREYNVWSSTSQRLWQSHWDS